MSAFFSGSRSSMAPSWRVACRTVTQSTTGQSGGELAGAHGARLYARERAAIRKSSNKACAFFYILRSHFWGRNLDPKLGPPICPAIKIRQKSLTPFLGPQNSLVFFFRGPACCNLIFALSGDSFLADGSLRGCQVCRQGGVVFERGGNLACKSI